MKSRRFSVALLGATALGAVLLVSRTIDVDLHWRDNTARAIDLFGSSEKKEEGKGTSETTKPFWNDSKDGVPLAEPPKQASFADLAQPVSPSGRSLRHSQTGKGCGGAEGA